MLRLIYVIKFLLKFIRNWLLRRTYKITLIISWTFRNTNLFAFNRTFILWAVTVRDTIFIRVISFSIVIMIYNLLLATVHHIWSCIFHLISWNKLGHQFLHCLVVLDIRIFYYLRCLNVFKGGIKILDLMLFDPPEMEDIKLCLGFKLIQRLKN